MPRPFPISVVFVAIVAAAALGGCPLDLDPVHGTDDGDDDDSDGDGLAPLSPRVVVPVERADCEVLPPADDPLEVRTTWATVRGHEHVDGGFAWKGIRYGAPPVGALRFAPPADPACVADVVVDAANDPPQCLQAAASENVAVGQEDCLFLNVYRPERRDDDPAALPVLFWIHGGAQILGSGNQPALFGNLYEGARLAEAARVVVVSVNYRLGAFGFLTHESLRQESGAVGNWAHYDVVKALEWTRDNITGFGGDPNRVTIFGESAGAHNVGVMLASPKAAGLFHGAILQSGGYEVAPQEDRLAQGNDLVDSVGCNGGDRDLDDVAACLRARSGAEIFLTAPSIPPLMHAWWLPFGSTVDGEILTDQPMEIIRRGEHNAVPTIVGSNRDEVKLFLGLDVPLTCFDLRLQLELLLGPSFDDDPVGNVSARDQRDDLIDDVLDTYRCGSRLITHDVLIEAATDLVFTCNARRLSRALQVGGAGATPGPGVYRYHFRDRANYGPLLALGAFHLWELPYLFDSFGQLGYIPTDGERALSGHLQRAWGRMAHTGSPSAVDGSNDPVWGVAVDDNTLVYDEDPFASLGGEPDIFEAGDPSPNCDLWDRFAY